MADQSDSSGLSEHSDHEIQKLAPIFRQSNKKKSTRITFSPASPPRPKRPASPPHEEVLADNADIAFIVMFRSRFNDILPTKLSHFGPQDVERGVVDTLPTPQMENLLCALLGLVLNRKKPVERGHYGRALEEAMLSQKSQWPRRWNQVNPLRGDKTFANMVASERLNLLRTLIMWSLEKSEAVQAVLKEKYKQQRHSDDENQPLSVQPWGFDGDKRRYFLIQGLDDTGFRVYREGFRHTKNAYWWSVAGSIEEAKELASKLYDVDGSQAARRLAAKIYNAVPMFEATEEKRRRREYRQIRRAAFTRPEPGFSLYEGRTRGRRARYTYNDEDSDASDDINMRRSARNSARSTPFDAGPTITASGRQVRQPRTGNYGESLLSGPPMTADNVGMEWSGTEDSEQPPRRAGRLTRERQAVNGGSNLRKRKHIDDDSEAEDMSDDGDVDVSDAGWDSERNEAEDHAMPHAMNSDDDMSADDDELQDEDTEPQSLLLTLRLPSKALSSITNGIRTPATSSATEAENSATARAPKCETEADHPDSRSFVKVDPGTHAQRSLERSPTLPSAYPTPNSFLSSHLDPKPDSGLPTPMQLVNHSMVTNMT